jgi:hypothetical protein
VLAALVTTTGRSVQPNIALTIEGEQTGNDYSKLYDILTTEQAAHVLEFVRINERGNHWRFNFYPGFTP